MRKMVLSILVDNTFGVLSRVAGLFSRRGYNIDSLTVGVTENSNFSRMTVVVTGDEQILDPLSISFCKLVNRVVSIYSTQSPLSYYYCHLVKCNSPLVPQGI